MLTADSIAQEFTENERDRKALAIAIASYGRVIARYGNAKKERITKESYKQIVHPWMSNLYHFVSGSMSEADFIVLYGEVLGEHFYRRYKNYGIESFVRQASDDNERIMMDWINSPKVYFTDSPEWTTESAKEAAL